MKKIMKYKLSLILVAIIILSIVALVKPEYVESVARAFMILIVGV